MSPAFAAFAFAACAHSESPVPAAPPAAVHASPAPAQADERSEVADDPAGDRAAASIAPVPLENAAVLARFFQRLADLEAGRAGSDVRVVQFGDSHTQSDLGTGSVRRALQARFGDGGRGFIPLVLPAKGWLQTGVRADVPREWTIARMKMKRRKGEKTSTLTGDGFYGLGGVSAVAQKPGGRLWLEVPASPRVEIAYLEQPRGGAFDVYIDGARAARVPSAAKSAVSAYRAFDLPDAPHRIELEAHGGGEARIFGVTLDRPALGITLDALGIVGARASGILEWNEAHFGEQLRHRAPDLVIFAYGTNEASYDIDIPAYEKQLTDVLARVARAVPERACLLLGPPDWVQRGVDGAATPQKLFDVIATQRRVALSAGCAFFDQFEVMGGAGSMEDWASATPPLGRSDRVHLTKAGYERLATAFVNALLASYDDWRDENVPEASPAPAPAKPAVAGTDAGAPATGDD